MDAFLEFTGAKVAPVLAVASLVVGFSYLFLFVIFEKMKRKRNEEALRRLKRMRKSAKKKQKEEQKSQKKPVQPSLLVRILIAKIRETPKPKD